MPSIFIDTNERFANTFCQHTFKILKCNFEDVFRLNLLDLWWLSDYVLRNFELYALHLCLSYLIKSFTHCNPIPLKKCVHSQSNINVMHFLHRKFTMYHFFNTSSRLADQKRIKINLLTFWMAQRTNLWVINFNNEFQTYAADSSGPTVRCIWFQFHAECFSSFMIFIYVIIYMCVLAAHSWIWIAMPLRHIDE